MFKRICSKICKNQCFKRRGVRRGVLLSLGRDISLTTWDISPINFLNFNL